jgi:hypothetical protein
MPVLLSTLAVEKSTYPITISFFDEDGAAVVPNASTITWSLFDSGGNVINERTNVPAVSAASITIVLSGNDLALGSYGSLRVLKVECLYNSDLGSNLPLKDSVSFRIEDLVGVP